jgi:hypothetical protein
LPWPAFKARCRRLREVNADGPERWEPIMKQAFPLPAAA